MFVVTLLLRSSPPPSFGLTRQAVARYASASSRRRQAAKPVSTEVLNRGAPSAAAVDGSTGEDALMSPAGEGQEEQSTVARSFSRNDVAAAKDSRNRERPAAQQQEQQQWDRTKKASSAAAVDPLETVTYNSKTKELHFNAMQREALWDARRKEYQSVLVRIAVVLQGHLSSEAKCHALLAIHERYVVQRRLRLRTDTYDDIFHAISAVATSERNRADSCLTVPYLNEVWVLYRYMIDSGTQPSPKIIQFVMSVLELVRVKNVDVEARAHSLMIDCDTRSMYPTAFTLHSYFYICGVNNVMHIALARLHDVRTRHQVQPTPSMCSMIIQGLAANGQIKEAVRFISSIDAVAITEALLNSILNVMRKSGDPLSVFTAYRSVRGSQVPISRVTVHIMVQAMLDAKDFSELSFVMREMKRFAIRGDAKLLNNLLGMLCASGRMREYSALLKTMQRQGVRVFDENRLRSPEIAAGAAADQLALTDDADHRRPSTQ